MRQIDPDIRDRRIYRYLAQLLLFTKRIFRFERFEQSQVAYIALAFYHCFAD
jgi:hypothetical protein